MKPAYQMTRDEWLRDGVEYVTTKSDRHHGVIFSDQAVKRRPSTDAGHRWHIQCACWTRRNPATGVGGISRPCTRVSITGEPLRGIK